MEYYDENDKLRDVLQRKQSILATFRKRKAKSSRCVSITKGMVKTFQMGRNHMLNTFYRQWMMY